MRKKNQLNGGYENVLAQCYYIGLMLSFCLFHNRMFCKFFSQQVLNMNLHYYSHKIINSFGL